MPHCGTRVKCWKTDRPPLLRAAFLVLWLACGAAPARAQGEGGIERLTSEQVRACYREATGLVRANDYRKALADFERLIRQPQEANYQDLSSLWAAFIYEQEGLNNKAILTYLDVIQRSRVPAYKAYANMGLYFLREKISSRSFNYQWVPTRVLNRFFLLQAADSPDAFKYYLFNVAPTILTVLRLAMFAAFWMLCMLLSRFELFQRESFVREDAFTYWDFKDVLWLYVLFSVAQTLVFFPFHGSAFFMADVERGLYVESILRMVMLAAMTLAFFKFRNMNLRSVLVGVYDRKLWGDLLLRYTGYILLLTGMIGFVSRYELFGFEHVARNYQISWASFVSGTGLYKTVLVLFAAPVAEELFYRAVVLTGLERYFRPGVAVVLCAMVFAAVHLNAQAFPVIFIMATFLARAFLKTRSIAIPVAIHFLYNLVSLSEIIRLL